jgi:hypothetical protein
MTTGNPTLREGMHSADGWVEYLEGRLNEYFWGRKDFRYSIGDGHFTHDTKKAVEKFQEEQHVKVDGVVGDQTWAALNGNPQQQDVGTDGYPAGQYVQQGKQLRFNPEGSTGYAYGGDQLILQVWNVGTEKVAADDVRPTVHVRTPEGGSHEPTKFTGVGGGGGGEWFELIIDEVSGTGPLGRYSALIQLPMEYGGDTMQMEYDKVQ